MINIKRNKFLKPKKLIPLSFILIGTTIITFFIITDLRISYLEDKAINSYYENSYLETDDNYKNSEEKLTQSSTSKIQYIAILTIPKINLKKGLVDKNSKLNDVNHNIEILKDSDMPDKEKGNVILASHSGNSRISFFKDLNKLSLKDELSIDYMNQTYRYEVTNVYEIDKTGNAKIVRNHSISTLTLITCKHNTNKQIIVICDLIP